MSTPQDDLFNGTSLDPKWQYVERPGSSDLGYSLLDNPGNITLRVKAASRIDSLNGISRLIQETIHQYYYVETQVTTTGISQNGHSAGIVISEDANNYIFFCKEYSSGVSRVALYQMVGGMLSLVGSAAFTDDTDILLKVVKFGGVFSFYYKKAEDLAYTTLANTISDAGYGYGAGTGRYIGLGCAAGDAGAPTFNYLINAFFFRRMRTVQVDGDIALRISNIRTVNGDILLVIKNYSPVSGLEVKQHIGEPYNTLAWTNPSDPGYVSTIIKRKENGYPASVSDGTTIVDSNTLTTFVDGPFTTRARQFYAAFAVYSAKTSYADNMATMPIFNNLFVNVGSRFTKAFLSIAWSILYSFAKALTVLSDIDLPAAMSQFNVNTATAEFLDLWARLFGTRRYPNEGDRDFAPRIISRVITPRTTTQSIINAVSMVPGVVYCDLLDSSRGSMFIGHSYIGFAGTTGTESKSSIVKSIYYSEPFYFTVRVRIISGTDLNQIIKAIDDNRAAGTRYNIEILETLT